MSACLARGVSNSASAGSVTPSLGVICISSIMAPWQACSKLVATTRATGWPR